MAAHALVSLVSTSRVIPMCQQLVEALRESEGQTTNEIHGRLCQLYQLLRHYPQHQPIVSSGKSAHTHTHIYMHTQPLIVATLLTLIYRNNESAYGNIHWPSCPGSASMQATTTNHLANDKGHTIFDQLVAGN